MVTASPSEDSTLTRLEDITKVLEQKLVEGDASSVESLVVEQCVCLRLLSGKTLTVNELDRLLMVKEKVLIQQKLIEQALEVTEYFLGNLNQQNSFSYKG